jgi:hypothetical protein
MARIRTVVRVLLALLPAAAWGIFDFDTLDVNRWALTLSNYGMFGHDPARNSEGGEWPRGSGHYYVFGAGLWAGALCGDTYTQVGYNPNSGRSELTPGDSAGGIADSAVVVYVSPDNWPPPWGRFPRAPQQPRSDQDAWCCFDDFDTTLHESLSGPGRPPRRSLGLQTWLTTFASTGWLARDFVYLHYEFQNQGQDSLRGVRLGIAMDADIGGANNDYYRGYYHRRFPRGPADSVYLDNLACVYSDDESGWDTTGTVAAMLIHTPGSRGVTAMRQFTLQAGDPYGDAKQYLALAGYDWWVSPPVYNPIESLDYTPGDKRFLVATGPFDLAPGQVESLVAVVIAVNARPDRDPLRVLGAAWVAESLYLAGFPLAVSEPAMTPLYLRDVPFAVYPNPFKGKVQVRCQVPVAGRVSLRVYDIGGREVNTLCNQDLTPGTYNFTWNGADHTGNAVSAGVYFYQLETPTSKLARKVTLLR